MYDMLSKHCIGVSWSVVSFGGMEIDWIKISNATQIRLLGSLTLSCDIQLSRLTSERKDK